MGTVLPQENVMCYYNDGFITGNKENEFSFTIYNYRGMPVLIVRRYFI